MQRPWKVAIPREVQKPNIIEAIKSSFIITEFG